MPFKFNVGNIIGHFSTLLVGFVDYCFFSCVGQVFIDQKTKKIDLKIQKIDFIDLTKFRRNK